MNPALLTRVCVVADQPLVSDVVTAALDGNGFRCSQLGWPGRPESDYGSGEGTVDDSGDGWQPPVSAELGLLVSDLDRAALIRGAVRLLLGVKAPWLVLTGVPRGPLWGALLELGCVHVAAATTSLDEVRGMLRALGDGVVLTQRSERAALIDSWWVMWREHEDLMARIDSMTPRETQVLRLLYAGRSAREVAGELGVAETTVRTQVKRVLRKLDVNSQLAAVAAFEQVRRAETSLHDVDAVTSTMWWARQLGSRQLATHGS